MSENVPADPVSIDATKVGQKTAAPLSLRELLEAYPNVVRAISVLSFLCFWEVAGRRMDPVFMTYPSAVFEAGIQLAASGELLRALAASLVPFTIGMVVSIVLGIAIGLAMGLSRVIEYAVDPFVNALNAVPRIALVPLIMLWFGLGVAAKIIIVISIAIFPIIINTFAGVRDVRETLLDIGRAYSASHQQMLFKITIKASIPFIMTGVRLGLGLGIIGIVVAEFFTALAGLGGLIVEYGNTFQMAKMFVPIVVIGLVGILLSEGVMVLERHFMTWRVGEGRES